MKRCKKCNTIVDDQDKFCYVCGEQIPPYTRRRLILIATTLIIFSSIFGIFPRSSFWQNLEDGTRDFRGWGLLFEVILLFVELIVFKNF
jgi:hypothetical protein